MINICRCLRCNKKFRSGNLFQRHIEGDHKVSLMEYRACLIRRLKDPHAEFRPDEDAIFAEKPAPPALLTSTTPNIAPPAMSVTPPKPATTNPSVHWFDGCLYKCFRCPDLLHSKDSLKAHCQDAHGITLNEMKSGRDQMHIMFTRPNLKCLECQSRVTHNREKMRTHLRKKHGLSLEDYYSRHKVEIDAMTAKMRSDNEKKKQKRLSSQSQQSVSGESSSASTSAMDMTPPAAGTQDHTVSNDHM